MFDADTLEERPGGPRRFLPGARVTGMARLGLSPRVGALPPRKNAGDARSGGASPQRPSVPIMEAVGGDVIAVACCLSAPLTADGTKDKPRRQPLRWKDATGGGDATGPPCFSSSSSSSSCDAVGTDTSDRSKADALATVIAAFEVVAFGGDGAADQDNTKNDILLDAGKSGSNGNVVSCNAPPRPTAAAAAAANDDGGKKTEDSQFIGGTITSLESLAASEEMPGACFCLETLGGGFVAASVDDRVVIFGWIGQENGSSFR